MLCCEVLWGVVRCCEVLWGVVRCCEVLWGVMSCCEVLWNEEVLYSFLCYRDVVTAKSLPWWSSRHSTWQRMRYQM